MKSCFVDDKSMSIQIQLPLRGGVFALSQGPLTLSNKDGNENVLLASVAHGYDFLLDFSRRLAPCSLRPTSPNIRQQHKRPDVSLPAHASDVTFFAFLTFLKPIPQQNANDTDAAPAET